METDSIKGGTTGPQSQALPRDNRQSDFAKLLGEQEANRDRIIEQEPGTSQRDNSIPSESVKHQTPVLLGTITQNKPTVSHLLVGHPEYGRDYLGIIHSQQNRYKPLTKIAPGTAIFLDSKTLEITWGRGAAHFAQTPSALESETIGSPDSSVKQSMTRRGDSPSSAEAMRTQDPVLLGTITKSKPTVSHLLIEHRQYGRDCWRIIHADQNRHKPYTKIQPGTAIFLDPETLEIGWGPQSTQVQPTASAMQAAQSHRTNERARINPHDSFSARLANAVEVYIGKSHEEIDCYELVVRGLVTLGIRYQGNGGLRENLVKMAVQEGLPNNAYFNGEGLIEASGTKVYSKSFLRIKDSETQAREVMNELNPLLQKGLIVSFSTHTKGHTGVVSRRNSDWTFINSGKMDHDLGIGNEGELVGEEALGEEMKNWFELAASRKESLKVTVGRLDEKKLVTFDYAGNRIPDEA